MICQGNDYEGLCNNRKVYILYTHFIGFDGSHYLIEVRYEYETEPFKTYSYHDKLQACNKLDDLIKKYNAKEF